MERIIRYITFFILCFVYGGSGYAQPRGFNHPHPHPVIEKIERAFRNGEINLDKKILYQLYAGMKPEALPVEYQSKSSKPIKCGTPALMEFYQNRSLLTAGTLSQIESLLQKPRVQAEESYNSESDKFIVFYETSGNNAVPPDDADGTGTPDYVEWVAAAADSSWGHEVTTLGFTDPVSGSTDPYPIYIQNEGNGIYGYTDKRGFPGSTFIVINSNLDNPAFQSNDDLNKTRGAIKVTAAHELKHAIQYANSEWTGEAGSISWSEMDATLMEEVVYDNVNDYYNYLTEASIFKSPGHSIPASYNGVTWSIFMVEKYGINFWVNVWQQIKLGYESEKNKPVPQYPKMTETIDAVLDNDYSDSYQNALSTSHLWHFASGPAYAVASFGFEERDAYPDPTINTEILGIADMFSDTLEIPGSSADYYLARALPGDRGNISFTIDTDSPGLSVGFLFYFKGGDFDARSVPLSGSGTTTHDSIWKWEEVEKVGIVVSNSDKENARYRYKVFASAPQEYILAQNYPNPFNPGTTIRFSIPEATHVELKIYDYTGRLVRTLIDERRNADFYEEPFDGSGLASGVYIYRLVTGNRVLTKKMTLIK